MTTFVHILFAILSVSLGVCTAHALIVFFNDPIKFIYKPKPKERIQIWIAGAYVCTVFFGISVAVYAATTSFLWWIPWTRTDDGHAIAAIAAFFGGVGVLSGMERIAANIKNKTQQISELTAEVERLRSANKSAQSFFTLSPRA